MQTPPRRARIVYLALADARGHLMRAHLLRCLLAPRGVDVEVVTTSEAGRRFLAALGTPADVVSSQFRMVFDDRHNIRPHRTTARTLLYLASPWGLLVDRRRLMARSRGAAFVVSDSLHPALLLAPRRQRVVQVYGENIRRATYEHLGRRSSWLGRMHRAVLERGLHRAFGQLEHTLAEPAVPGPNGRIQLPPIIPCPRARPHRGDRPRAVVYLNPHFRDPAIADAIEGALTQRGLTIHAVGEGFARRDGWSPLDARLVDHVAGADLFITGAGMGGLGMARTFDVPTVCLVTRQPEQRANARQTGSAPTIAPVFLPTTRALAAELGDAIDRVRTVQARPPSTSQEPSDAAQRVQQQWVSAFMTLLARAERQPVSPPRIH